MLSTCGHASDITFDKQPCCQRTLEMSISPPHPTPPTYKCRRVNGEDQLQACVMSIRSPSMRIQSDPIHNCRQRRGWMTLSLGLMEAETVSHLSRPLSRLSHRSLDRSLALTLTLYSISLSIHFSRNGQIKASRFH